MMDASRGDVLRARESLGFGRGSCAKSAMASASQARPVGRAPNRATREKGGRMFRRIAATTLLVLTIAACGVVTNPIEVTSLTPEDGATGVPVDVQLEAAFSQSIDETTLAGNFSLSGPGGDVAGTIAYDAMTQTATFTPDADLAFDTTYTATIAGSVATTDGETLAGDASWSFTTAAEVAPALEITSLTPSDGA